MSASGRTSKYDTLEWLKELNARGYKEYWYSTLPDDLKNPSFHRKASAVGYTTPIGKDMYGTMKWKIPTSTLKLTNSNQKARKPRMANTTLPLSEVQANRLKSHVAACKNKSKAGHTQRITALRVMTLKKLAASGCSKRQICLEMHCSRQTLNRAISGYYDKQPSMHN